MQKYYIFPFFIFSLFLLSSNPTYAQNMDLYPGTPSSSYNFNYSSPKKIEKFNDSIRVKQPKSIKKNKLQVKVKGNVRLDKAVIIRDSKIND